MIAGLRQQPWRPGLDLAQKAGPGPPQKKKKEGMVYWVASQPNQTRLGLT
jgi:hypothetical protein